MIPLPRVALLTAAVLLSASNLSAQRAGRADPLEMRLRTLATISPAADLLADSAVLGLSAGQAAVLHRLDTALRHDNQAAMARLSAETGRPRATSRGAESEQRRALRARSQGVMAEIRRNAERSNAEARRVLNAAQLRRVEIEAGDAPAPMSPSAGARPVSP